MADLHDVLEFWFPPELDRDLPTHHAQWQWWMGGGASAEIAARFSGLCDQASRGELKHWTASPEGRLALVLVFDQFNRSVFAGDARAYAQDAAALVLVQEGLDNGHFAALDSVWKRTFFAMPLVHAEGADAAQRADLCLALAKQALMAAPQALRPMYEFCCAQARLHREVLHTFGRHPHRNQILGRESTPAEVDYLRAGNFPHLTKIEL